MRLACMFPGQGSQSIGMLKDFEQFKVFSDVFGIAKEVMGIDYWHLAQTGPVEDLNDTENTQVVMLIADVALYRYLISTGMPEPVIMAGHSLGEYAALVCANSLEFTDALKVVSARARFMKKSAGDEKGAMAAIIGLGNAEVDEICQSIDSAYHNKALSVANYNAIGQAVIAGNLELVEEAIVAAEKHGARMTKILPVSVPCHCDMMLYAGQQLETVLEQIKFKIPTCKVISNVNSSAYENVNNIKELLIKQVFSPVRWTDTLAVFAANNVDACIECGPGKVLTGLAKRTIPEVKAIFCSELQHIPVWDKQ